MALPQSGTAPHSWVGGIFAQDTTLHLAVIFLSKNAVQHSYTPFQLLLWTGCTVFWDSDSRNQSMMLSDLSFEQSRLAIGPGYFRALVQGVNQFSPLFLNSQT